MSRSPQNGGFHRCTGGSPFLAPSVLAAVLAAAVRSSRPRSVPCPWFAMVCPEFVISHDGSFGTIGAGLNCKSTLYVGARFHPALVRCGGRHFVMPYISPSR